MLSSKNGPGNEFPQTLRIASAERIGRAVELMEVVDRLRCQDHLPEPWRKDQTDYLLRVAELNLGLVVAVCLVKLAGDGVVKVTPDNLCDGGEQ